MRRSRRFNQKATTHDAGRDDRGFQPPAGQDTMDEEHGHGEADAPATSKGPVPGREPEKSQGDGGKRKDPALGRRRRVVLAGASVAIFLAAAGFIGYGAYQSRTKSGRATGTRQPQQRRPGSARRDSESDRHAAGDRLPATTQAFDAATIYARQSGYIAQRLVDIGSRVKAGDLLALSRPPRSTTNSPRPARSFSRCRQRWSSPRRRAHRECHQPAHGPSRKTGVGDQANRRREPPYARRAKRSRRRGEIEHPGAESADCKAGEGAILRACGRALRWRDNPA